MMKYVHPAPRVWVLSPPTRLMEGRIELVDDSPSQQPTSDSMGAPTLYKYRAINEWSLDSLRSGQMWFSLPDKLNDTFEFSIPHFIRFTPAELVEHFENRFKIDYVAPKLLEEMMKYGGGKSFPATEQCFRDFLNSTEPKNRMLFIVSLIHFLREQGLKTEAIVTKLNLNASNDRRDQLESDLREAYEQNQAVGKSCGVLSLSGHNNDPLMWAHYADSCRGMCIGVTLDTDRLVESEFIPIWVEYAAELPVLGASAFFDRKPDDVMSMIKAFYGTKYIAWKHEAEFRLISTKGDAIYDLPGRITEVILGEKVRESDTRNVLSCIAKGSGTKVLKMSRKPGTWNYLAYGETM